ncbi:MULTISPECIES: MIP/aquaporin family protein [Burkholderiaceae]|uniref:MIP/aquaporin family protein n=1 Tax=Burkholderiaceae TaxID=119060 RepID=UPI00095F825D|nr:MULTISPECIES: MIP/aquaporin family protein [Burkholderiaceae]MCG1019830.1 aquaporin family protein [Mycetohabitans sp. B4]SIT80271.1 glycerol uptake facilitator protein [Burkholderia sp. b13]
MTNALIAEFIGTALLVLLGDGVVANVILGRTKGHNSGLIVITIGWAMAVFVGVLCSAAYSGAHLNPAVSVALAVAGKFVWAKVPAYAAAQMLGGMFGAFVVWLVYRKHFESTDGPDTKLAVFCTGPAIRNTLGNLTSEIVATFVLVYAVLHMAAPSVGLGAINALPVALVVLGIGVSLGGTTGYAMNPARDLSPRIMHALLPIPGKRDSDWGYAWVPVAGSLIGGVLAAVVSVQQG